MHAAWKEEMQHGIPLPEKLYCSPMTRAMRTCELTFGGIINFAERPPLVLEVSQNPIRIYGLCSN